MNTQVGETEKNQGRDRNSYVKPRYEVSNRENTYYIDVYMPGVPRENANIVLEGDTLTIEGKRLPYKRAGWKVLNREIREEGYKLDLQLNVDIDSEGITAKSDQGILTVALPVAAKVAHRAIPID